MDDITLVRAVHVLAVLHWIGGVAFVTAVILPAARACPHQGSGWISSSRSSGASRHR